MQPITIADPTKADSTAATATGITIRSVSNASVCNVESDLKRLQQLCGDLYLVIDSLRDVDTATDDSPNPEDVVTQDAITVPAVVAEMDTLFDHYVGLQEKLDEARTQLRRFGKLRDAVLDAEVERWVWKGCPLGGQL